MIIPPPALTEMLGIARSLFLRFLAGFDDASRTLQAPGLPNHACWTLGHCALYAHRAAEVIRRQDAGLLPAAHWVTADGFSGQSSRFDTESVCFGSTPKDDPAIYPTLDVACAAFGAAHDELARSIVDAGEAGLSREVSWGHTPRRADRLAVQMVVHLGTHAGQLADLRRALGMPRVIG